MAYLAGDPMMHCVRWGRFGVEPKAETCNCKLLLPLGNLKRKSDLASYQIYFGDCCLVYFTSFCLTQNEAL